VTGGDIVARGGDAFGVPGLRTSPTGVIDWPVNMTFEQWDDLGLAVCEARDCTGWWIGDWLLFGEATFGETYAQARALTGRSYGGLRNLSYVARHVPRSRRCESLSWSHHAVVAPLEPEEQIAWLDRAEAGGWSVDLLASTLRDARSLVTSGDTMESETVESPSASQLMIERPSLREVAAEIVAAERDEHGRTCIGSNVLERLRAALAEEPEVQ
jgi:hypothetical protein